MTMEISEHAAGQDLLDRSAAFLRGVTERLAAAGVMVMLVIGIASMVDIVVFRTVLNRSLPGMNELLQTVFAAALAAVLASSIAQRTSLRVDVLLKWVGRRWEVWLDLASDLLLLVFFAMLVYGCWHQTALSFTLNSQSTILHIPLGPFTAAITVFVAICLPVQAMNLLLSLRNVLHFNGWTSQGAFVAGAAGLIASLIVIVDGGYQLIEALRPHVAENPTLWAGVIFFGLWLVVLLGIPVAVCLGMSGIVGAALMLPWSSVTSVTGNETTELFMNASIALIPLFLMMGAFASVAGLSSDIYRLAQAVLGSRKGGLAMATVGACAGFGALTGSSIATAATIGSVALPEMRERGYADSLATGCVAAGATLGQLIPPSTVIVLYALLVEESIGKLYMAILVPAFLTIVMYLIAIAVVVRLRPEIAPGVQPFSMSELLRASRQSIVVIAIFLVVVVGIYLGIYTATEAASIGMVLTFATALIRGKLKGEALWTAARETTAAVGLLYPLMIGALLLTFYMDLAGLASQVTDYVRDLHLTPLMTIVVLCLVFIALGSVMDSIAVMIITAGLVAPLVVGLGYDALWWGVMMVVIVELGVVSPPFGLNLFMLQALAPSIRPTTIYRGVMPFVFADTLKVVLLIAFPVLATWLPSTMR